MPRTAIYYVGIYCDRCGRTETGDVSATGQPAAEDGLRATLAADKGWRCDPTGDLCPACLPADPAEPAPDPAPAVPDADATWDEVDTVTALHQLDDALDQATTTRPARNNPDLWR